MASIFEAFKRAHNRTTKLKSVEIDLDVETSDSLRDDILKMKFEMEKLIQRVELKNCRFEYDDKLMAKIIEASTVEESTLFISINSVITQITEVKTVNAIFAAFKALADSKKKQFSGVCIDLPEIVSPHLKDDIERMISEIEVKGLR